MQEFNEFMIDHETSARIPTAHWDIYQADKTAYLADPDAALAAFADKAAKSSKPNKLEE